MKQALILYNTQSGHAKIAGRLAGIVDIFRSGGYEVRAEQIRFGVNPFESVGDADIVVACGGDGTVNYVINAMNQRLRRRHRHEAQLPQGGPTDCLRT